MANMSGILENLSPRVRALREESYLAEVWLDVERAEIVTDFYQRNEGKYSIPVLRAMVFKEICRKKTIYLGSGELIVGERGSRPKAVPTYPEIACHSLEDLELLKKQERIPYLVDDHCQKIYQEKIIPYWRGRSLRDRIFASLDHAWHAAYEAGIFTEFMEQRAPGNSSLDESVYYLGLSDLQGQIDQALENLDFLNDMTASSKREQLQAMKIAAEGAIILANRYADLAEDMAAAETDLIRKAELEKISSVCKRVPEHAPRDLWEALQMYWFLHLGIITEINGWDACNPAHVDRNFYPFYKKDIETGKIDKAFAKELLSTFWIKFNNQPAPAKYGVTAEESGSYNDFVNINLGGMNEDGSDAVNELSFLFLEIMEEIGLIQPQANIQLSQVNSDRFLKAACRVIRRGYGYPSVFNADNIIQQQLICGKSLADARSGGINGCVETCCHGKEAAIDTGYLNGPKILELTLNNGYDRRTKKQLGPKTGEMDELLDFDQFFAAFKKQAEHMINLKISNNQYIERIYAKYMPVPFLSNLIKDCIAKGKDYNDGGPRYNCTYIQCVGIGTMSDSLSSIRHHIYEQKNFDWSEVLAALKADYKGYEYFQQIFLKKTPRYGNDDKEVDLLMQRVANMFIELIDGHKNTKGDYYRVVMLPTTCHIYFGSVTYATPDGRMAGQPLSEGISAGQGASIKGPTAALKSAAKMDHSLSCGALLNMKFSPELLAGEGEIENMAAMIRTYFRLGGNHLQFNIVDKETLLAAQAQPDAYRDLIVRVAGYSDYFCVLGRELQDEIINRTEHSAF